MTKGPRGLAHQRVHTGPDLISPQTLKVYLHSRSFCHLLTTHNCIPIINLFSYCTPPFSRNHCVSKNNKFCFVRKERLLLGKIHFQVIDYDYD